MKNAWGKPHFSTIAGVNGVAGEADVVRYDSNQGSLNADQRDSSITYLNDRMKTVGGKMNTPVSAVDIQSVKDYLDENFKSRISLNDLANRFYINKHYMQSLFKDRYGCTINTYQNNLRITWVKQQLRFTDKTLEELSIYLGIEPPYLSRLFRR